MMLMQRTLLGLVLSGFMVSCVGAQPCTPSDLVWMMGEWVRESPRGTYVERWHVQSDSTFEGFSEVRSPAGELRAYEALRIVAMGGEVFYIAKVGENALPVPFKMVSCEPGEVRFENAAHDFPKSLTYTQEEAGRLHVAVRGEGEDGFDLHFKRRP